MSDELTPAWTLLGTYGVPVDPAETLAAYLEWGTRRAKGNESYHREHQEALQ